MWNVLPYSIISMPSLPYRTSERRYYQKITDIYAECSADYDAKAESTKLFFKMVQNIMHLAVTHHTAAEIVYNRADAEQPHMGLTTWKKAPDGRVQKSDTIVAKNYLSDAELDQLNGITSSFLDLAENRARRHIVTTMEDWRKRLAQSLCFLSTSIRKTNNYVTQLSQMEEVREVKEVKAICFTAKNIQPKRLLAITSNDRRE